MPISKDSPDQIMRIALAAPSITSANDHEKLAQLPQLMEGMGVDLAAANRLARSHNPNSAQFLVGSKERLATKQGHDSKFKQITAD